MTAVIFVDSGTEIVSDLIMNGGGTATFYIGWGTGGSSTGATATNTDVDLAAAATEARVTATTEDQPSGDTNRWIGRLTAETSKTIEEVGLFQHGTGTATDMIIRGSHGGLTLATDDIVEYTVTLQMT